MDLMMIFLIAVSLSMDAFAVSVVYGFDLEHGHPARMSAIALTFGAFQALMPAIGWFAGKSVYRWIEPVDHWVVFILLAGLGVKMIIDAMKRGEERIILKYSAGMLLLMGFLTSIDALAAGISLALVDVKILLPVLIIGVVTFLISYAGIYIGRVFGIAVKGKADLLGGLILILIGTRILLTHLKGC